MATERIEIVITERGARTVVNNIDGIGRSGRQAANGIDMLKQALGALTVGAVVRELIQMADAYTNLQNRLKLVTTGTANLTRVTNELFAVANKTRSSFESTAQMYARMALSSRELGTSQQDLLDFVKGLNQAVILSGANVTEANNAILQLSQGMASGRLQGDELRAVLEQLPMVADVIAEHLGVTRGQLRKMGQDGQITAKQIIEAFKAARQELEEKFAKTSPTIGQGFTLLRNEAVRLWGEFTTGHGIVSGLGEALGALAANLDTIARILGAAVWTTFVTYILPAAARGVMTLTAAIAANPLGALLVAVTAAIGLLATFYDRINLGGNSIAHLGDLAKATWETIQKGFAQLSDFLTREFGFLAIVWENMFGSGGSFSLRAWLVVMARGVDRFVGFFRAAYFAIVALFEELAIAISNSVAQAVNKTGEILENSINGWIKLANKFRGDDPFELANFDEMKVQAQDLGAALNEALAKGMDFHFFEEGMRGILARAEEIAKERLKNQQGAGDLNPGGPGVPPTGAIDKNIAKFEEWIRDIEHETQSLYLNNRERERSNELYQLQDRLTRDLTASEADLANTMLDRLQAARDQDALKQQILMLEEEGKLAAVAARERAKLAEVLKFQEAVGRKATDTEREMIEGQVELNRQLAIYQDLLDEINDPLQQLNDREQALLRGRANGKISQGRFDEEMRGVRRGRLEQQSPTNFTEGFTKQFQIMQIEAENAFAKIGESAAEIFGPGGTLSQGIGDATARAIVFGESFKSAIRGVAQAILSQLISSIVQIGINMLLNATIGKAMMASTLATAAVTSQSLTALWTPPAILANIATLGGASAIGLSTLAASVGSAMGITAGLQGVAQGVSAGAGALGSFDEGGYTGNGSASAIAGVVHGQEWVSDAQTTRRYRPELEAMSNGTFGQGGTRVKVINNAPGVEHDVQQLSTGEVEIIARKVVQREAPGVVAADMNNPNGKTSKSLRRNTTTRRNRSS